MLALVSGSRPAADPVVQALIERGAQVTLVDDPTRAAVTVAGLRSGSVDCYIQLPLTLRPAGETVVGRVRHFLDAGLITRFRLAEKLLPLLSPTASVILVAGHTPVAHEDPDDHSARLAMLQLLAHALLADKGPDTLRVQVASAGQSSERLVAAAMDGESLEQVVDGRTAPTRPPDRSYEDWRVEMMGQVGIEV
jgi:hypothetical protein